MMITAKTVSQDFNNELIHIMKGVSGLEILRPGDPFTKVD